MNNFSYTHKSHETNTDDQARHTLWVVLFLALVLIGLAFYASTWYGTSVPNRELANPLPDATINAPTP